jgi:glycogen debranching enzyme
MFSGWGIRTMAMGKAGTTPSSITTERSGRTTTVSSLPGLARYGFRQDAAAIIAGIFEASWFFDARLPEVFSGTIAEHTVPRAVPHGLSPSGVGRRVADARHPHLARSGTEG